MLEEMTFTSRGNGTGEGLTWRCGCPDKEEREDPCGWSVEKAKWDENGDDSQIRYASLVEFRFYSRSDNNLPKVTKSLN